MSTASISPENHINKLLNLKTDLMFLTVCMSVCLCVCVWGGGGVNLVSTYVCGTLVIVVHLPAHKRDTDADRHVKRSPVFKFIYLHTSMTLIGIRF